MKICSASVPTALHTELHSLLTTVTHCRLDPNDRGVSCQLTYYTCVRVRVCVRVVTACKSFVQTHTDARPSTREFIARQTHLESIAAGRASGWP